MQASSNTEMKKSIADMEQDMGKYASLLATILKVQKQRSKTPEKAQPAKSQKTQALPKKAKAVEKATLPVERKKKSVLRPQAKPMATKPAKPIQTSKGPSVKPVASEKMTKAAESPKETKEGSNQVENDKVACDSDEQEKSEENVLELISHLAKKLKEDKNFLCSLVAKLNEAETDLNVRPAETAASKPIEEPAEAPAEPNYSERISQLEKQIQELSVMNSNLKSEYENSCKLGGSQIVPHLPPAFTRLSIEGRNSATNLPLQVKNDFLIEKLRQDLGAANQRCKVLEQMLEQKCSQVDKYAQIFKESNDQLRFLLSQIEEKQSDSRACNYMFSPADHLHQDAFIDSMRKNLTALQSKLLKCESSFQQPPRFRDTRSACQEIAKPNMHHGSNMFGNYKSELFSQQASAATSSDTLVDADSSFDSLNLDLLLKKNSIAKRHSYENDEEEEDESERIEIDLGELSFMTLQTCTSSATAKTVDSVSTLKSQDDVIFQDGLKKLDEKIYKVKQLLESIRPG